MAQKLALKTQATTAQLLLKEGENRCNHQEIRPTNQRVCTACLAFSTLLWMQGCKYLSWAFLNLVRSWFPSWNRSNMVMRCGFVISHHARQNSLIFRGAWEVLIGASAWWYGSRYLLLRHEFLLVVQIDIKFNDSYCLLWICERNLTDLLPTTLFWATC